jgi:hypothetical protein
VNLDIARYLVDCEYPMFTEISLYFVIDNVNSPFGKRCTCIHDPRIMGHHDSWLPHTEMQIPSLHTDVNVEIFYKKTMEDIHQGHPFGNVISLEKNDARNWSSLYSKICNMPYTSSNSIVIEERYQVAIALKMMGEVGKLDAYTTTHIVFNQVCMVTQCRAFRIPTNCAHETTMILNEITLNEYDETLSTDIFVHEITFSSNGASISTVKDAFLFFNLNPKTVQECTPKQAKKLMREQRVQQDGNDIVYPSRPFMLSRPQDRDAFQLTSMILRHRLENLCTEQIMDEALRCRTQARLIEIGTRLEVFFRRLVYNWRTWAWPVNKGREVATKDSPIPSTEANYDLPERNGLNYCGLVWESFKSTLEEVSDQIFVHQSFF